MRIACTATHVNHRIIDSGLGDSRNRLSLRPKRSVVNVPNGPGAKVSICAPGLVIETRTNQVQIATVKIFKSDHAGMLANRIEPDDKSYKQG